MKRLILPVIIVALAVTAFLFRDRWLPQPAGSLAYLGYVEGETALIGAPQAGRLVSVTATKGATVRPGDILFSLDPAQAEAELLRAQAAISTAEANHANLLSGKREEEIAVIRAQIRQAEATLELARKEYGRADTLASTGTAARSRLDTAAEQVKGYEARLAELQAALAVAALSARPAEIEAAASRIAEAKASADVARRKLADLSPAVPKAAKVEDVYFESGEWVAAGQPVVSLLSDGNITLRFFVPEADLAKAAPGSQVRFRCDGCGEVRTAAITSVASIPEYTPPVIYSEGARAKLVFLVEAKPDSIDTRLRPGLPIEVEALQ
jgi:HlyD family secretion protein